MRLPTIIIDADAVMDAIKAAVQVRPAKGTGLPSAHRRFDLQIIQAFMTLLHGFPNGRIFMRALFLFPRRSRNAGTAGTMIDRVV